MTHTFPFNLPTNLPRRYRYQIDVNFRFGSYTLSYVLVGAHGALSLNISGPYVYEGRENWSAGLEIHHRSPPEYMKNSPPSQDHCYILKAPCWHDGTSLYAQERYLPIVLRGEHGFVLESLVHEADERFGYTEEEKAKDE